MELQWMGVNAFRFVDGDRTILLDPYVSRQREPLCDPELVKSYFPKADAVIISHSHWDHLADAHVVALHTGAEVLGSRTTVNVCRSFGVPDTQLTEMAAEDAVRRDDLSVRFLASKHMPLEDGTVAYPGTYEVPPAVPPQKANEYLEGGTFAVVLEFGGLRILDIGSANLVDDALRGLEVDLVLLGCGGWQRTPNYLERVFSCVSTRWVVPCHQDDFLSPLTEPIVIRDEEGMEKMARRIPELSPGTEFIQLDLLESRCFPAVR